jgi:prepilin signal peptidase PulO-like enzyme (type II secretory pathway)
MNYNFLLLVLLGGLLGTCMLYLTRYFILKRTSEKAMGLLVDKSWSWILWALIGAVGCFIIVIISDDTLSTYEYMAIYFVLISLSVVDGTIRKIPNELLLALIILKLIFVGITGEWATLLYALAGFAVGWVLFVVPSVLGLSIGWGDVKLAAVTGFYLGIIGLIQAMVIMGIILAVYGAYLLITKKGSLKSKVAIGPPLSMGILVTLLYPIAAIINI